jgi:hypothetical protein
MYRGGLIRVNRRHRRSSHCTAFSSGHRLDTSGCTVRTAKLLLTATTSDVSTHTSSTIFATLPAGVAATPTPIATIDHAFYWTVANGQVLVTVAMPGAEAFSTEILALDGTVLQPLKAQSAFLPLAGTPGNPLLQVQDITDAGFLGGGSLYALTLGAGMGPTATRFMTPSGAPFTLPTGTADFSAVNFAPGLYVGGGAATYTFGLVYDANKMVVQLLNMNNTVIQFIYPIY